LKALVTGFEAWAGDANPASTIAKELNRKTIGGIEVVGVEVPEDFYRLPKLASRILKRVSPKVVLSLGWDLTSAIKVEKIAINVMASDFGGHVVPDNYNHRP
jgi:pyrrolidone-carboxylate peptidase